MLFDKVHPWDEPGYPSIVTSLIPDLVNVLLPIIVTCQKFVTIWFQPDFIKLLCKVSFPSCQLTLEKFDLLLVPARTLAHFGQAFLYTYLKYLI